LGVGDGIRVPPAHYGAVAQGRTVGGAKGAACASGAFACGRHPAACRCGGSALLQCRPCPPDGV